MADGDDGDPWAGDNSGFASLRDPRFAWFRAALEEQAEEHGRERALREEAQNVVRQAAGMADGDDLEDLLGILSSELERRGLKVSPRPLLDVQLDAVLGSSHVDEEQLQVLARDVAEGFLRGLGDLIGFIDDPPESTDEREPSPTGKRGSKRKAKRKRGGKPGSHRSAHRSIQLLVSDLDRTTEVVLDDGAGAAVADYQDRPQPVPDSVSSMPLIGAMVDAASRSADLGASVGLDHISRVIVTRTQDDEVEVALGGRRVGQLGGGAVAVFRPILSRQRGGRRASTMGLRYRDHRGVIHLWTYLLHADFYKAHQPPLP